MPHTEMELEVLGGRMGGFGSSPTPPRARALPLLCARAITFAPDLIEHRPFVMLLLTAVVVSQLNPTYAVTYRYPSSYP